MASTSPGMGDTEEIHSPLRKTTQIEKGKTVRSKIFVGLLPLLHLRSGVRSRNGFLRVRACDHGKRTLSDEPKVRVGYLKVLRRDWNRFFFVRHYTNTHSSAVGVSMSRRQYPISSTNLNHEGQLGRGRIITECSAFFRLKKKDITKLF